MDENINTKSINKGNNNIEGEHHIDQERFGHIGAGLEDQVEALKFRINTKIKEAEANDVNLDIRATEEEKKEIVEVTNKKKQDLFDLNQKAITKLDNFFNRSKSGNK